MRSKRTTITATLAAATAITVISLTACHSTSSSASRPPVSASSAAVVTPQQTTAAPATTAPAAPAAPATPAMTVSQQQAVDAAQEYLGDGQGFSYMTLLRQLTSSYGAGFPQADATFAISYLHPDWDAQAVDAAQGIEQVLHYGRTALINQLTSSYGSGFTYSQAAYAARQVGL